MSSLTIASKSPWHPAMRREHHFSLVAAAKGFDVTFIEQPSDIRSLNRGFSKYVHGLLGSPSTEAGIEVIRRSVVVPGHKGVWWNCLDQWQLRRILGPLDSPVVHYLPWQFGASASKTQRVFDCTDNWLKLYPESAGPRLRESFARIADEASEIIVVSPDLSELFPGRDPLVIPNGVDDQEIAEVVTPKPGKQRLVFVGTLSERFDCEALREIVGELPDWTVDLFGPCRFSGMGDAPSSELQQLIALSSGRIRLQGSVAKHEVARVLDEADVLIVPTVAGFARGQSSMKLLDAAARGRPAVVSPEVTIDGVTQPPGTYTAQEQGDWKGQILAAAAEDVSLGDQRRDFARLNTWEQRWLPWMSALGLQPNGENG
jgi:hypothetical protein